MVELFSHSIRQKSSVVSARGPCVAMYAFCCLKQNTNLRHRSRGGYIMARTMRVHHGLCTWLWEAHAKTEIQENKQECRDRARRVQCLKGVWGGVFGASGQKKKKNHYHKLKPKTTQNNKSLSGEAFSNYCFHRWRWIQITLLWAVSKKEFPSKRVLCAVQVGDGTEQTGVIT